MTASTIPGPAGSLLLGSLPELRRNTLDTYVRAHREFGDVVEFTAGPPGLRTRFYGLFGADGVQQMLATQAAGFRKDHTFYNEVRELLGNGLLTSQDDEYLRQRRLIQPLFTAKRVGEYARTMVDETEAAIRDWPSGDAPVIDVGPAMRHLTLRIVGTVLFGTDGAAAESTIRRHLPVASDYVLKRGFAPMRIPRTWPTPDNRRVALAQREMREVCDRIIATRHGLGGTDDLLDRLIGAVAEDGDRLTADEIRDQVLVFLLAGHETTAISLAFALHLLGRHPDVQDTAATEIAEVIGDRAPAAEDLPRLSYLTMVLKETMRLYPAAPIVGRRAVADSLVGEHVIPADANVLVSAWVTHRHPDYWDSPESFDPQRFQPTAVASRPRYAWFPFGGGPRACIGQHFSMLESVLALAVLLRRYRFEAVDTRVPVRSGVTLTATGPMRCRLTRR